MPDPRVKMLADKSNQWLLVGLIGFWLGFSFITGPLAWLGGSRVRQEYRQLGMQPSGTATAAWVIGIVSTGLTVLAVLLVISMFLFVASI